jgi:hypothetical protein
MYEAQPLSLNMLKPNIYNYDYYIKNLMDRITIMSLKDYKELSALMGEAQINFRKLHFSDFIRELAPRPTSCAAKVQLPQHFESVFPSDCSLSIVSVSGKKYSFWHALMSVLLPDFISTPWMLRKIQVDKLLEQLAYEAQSFFKSNAYIKKTTLSYEDLRLHDSMPSDILKYYIACLFDINLVIVDNIDVEFNYCEQTYDVNKPTVILYQDDVPIFYPVSINGESLITTALSDATYLMGRLPKVNPILYRYVTLASAGMKLYAELHQLSHEEQYIMQHRADLDGLKLTELQELAKKYGISAMKPSEKTTKLKFKTKDEITEEILIEASKK